MATARRLWEYAPRLAVRLRSPAKVLALVLVGFCGAWLGVSFLAATRIPVGPVETEVRLVPALYGDSVLALPPLGALTLDSHDGPLRLDLTVNGINQEDARHIFDNPTSLDGLQGQITSDIRDGMYVLGAKSLIAGTFGAAFVMLVVVRRLRPTLIAGGTAAAVILGSYGAAGLTWNPRAITEPRFDGLLTSAPSLIGTAQDIAENLNAYSEQLARLVTNVSKLYDVTSTLPAYDPGDDVIRVLHISDLELAEHAWDIVASVTEQYSVDLIVDTGDTTDHGSAAETQFLETIPYLGVPYVWVRGNHDSVLTEEAMQDLPNVTVLDGKVRSVKGIRFLGAGDPRFTPDRSGRNIQAETEAVAGQAQALAKVAEGESLPIDVVMYHDSQVGATFLDGHAPLILGGHYHNRKVERLPEGSRLMQQGSTGGSGLRALEREKGPSPIEMSVLYFGKYTKELEAWDEITLGGLGQRSAMVERHQVNPTEEEVTTPTPVPTPSGTPPETPLDTPTISESPTSEPTDESPGEGDSNDQDGGQDGQNGSEDGDAAGGSNRQGDRSGRRRGRFGASSGRPIDLSGS